MPLPLDYATRVFVGLEMRGLMVHLNEYVGAFSDYWDRTGDGTFRFGPESRTYLWESLDRTRAFGLDASNIHFEQRSLIPGAVEREFGEGGTGLPAARTTDELVGAVRADVGQHLREVMSAVHAGPVRRVGVVLEMEVAPAVVAAMVSPLVTGVCGASGVTEVVGRVVIGLDGADGVERRIILGAAPAVGTGPRLSRFIPAGPDIFVLTIDYQEVHVQPVVLLPRAARRAHGSQDVSELVISTMDRALEAFRGIAR